MTRWVWDASGSVVHRSEDWYELTGLNIEETGKQIRFDTIHPHDVNDAEHIITDSFNRKAPFILSFRLHHKNGSYNSVIVGGSPIFSLIDGSFLGYFGAIEPIDCSNSSQKVLNFLNDDHPGLNAPKIVNYLDSLCDHILTARGIASRINETDIVRMLDIVLLLLGDRFMKSIET